jgi:3-phenylpropionate/trans-cinnamate dioxygenase ferredoxin subunit
MGFRAPLSRRGNYLAFTRVGTVDEVPSGKVKVYDVGDREIAICNASGDLFAIDNVCSHDNGSLDQGELMGFEVECPRHGARFDIRNGEVTESPAFLPIDTFKVRISGNDIEVDL